MSESTHLHRRGLFAMLAATFFFAIMDMSLKLLSQHYPSFQVVMIRATSSLPVLLLLAPFIGGLRQLRTQRLKAHFIRGVLGLIMLALVVYSFRQLSLAYAYTIFFAGPLFITMLSRPLLGEQVGAHRWIAVLLGFVGVLVIANPQGLSQAAAASGDGAVGLGALAALLAALCYALIAITMRKLSSSESSLCISFYFLLVLLVGAGSISSFDWHPIDWRHAPIFLLIGTSGAAGMMSLATAFRSAQPAAIAPFEYTSLVWVMGLDYLVWQTVPGGRLYLGALIIIASGIYIIHRERRLHQRSKSASTQQNLDRA